MLFRSTSLGWPALPSTGHWSRVSIAYVTSLAALVVPALLIALGAIPWLARAGAIQVAERPGVAYNPLFIYGGVGLGKTHLIQAIGNLVLEQNSQAKVRYIHAEQYVSDVVKAYQHKAFDDFKQYYHSLDLLLIDDIQFFGGKNRTQEEFFYAFNALIEAHKQVIITCDSYPKEISGPRWLISSTATCRAWEAGAGTLPA